MSGSATFRNFVVGLVFLGSLVAVGIVTLQVTGLNLTGRSQMVRARFDRVSGLRTGDDVWYRGYRIGQVQEIEPLFAEGAVEPGAQDRPIRVTLRLQKAPPLTADTRFVVKSLGPLGGNYVDIIPGTGETRTAEVEFQGTASPDLFEEVGDLVRENRAAVKDALTGLQEVMRSIREREGTLGALVSDPVLRDRVTAAVINIENITRSISEGRGTVGKLIMEKKVHDDLEELISRASRIVSDVEAGRGTLGMLLKDEELARKLRDGVKDFQETIAKVNQGEGTAGQLINNREAWDRVVFVLRQVQEAVEDFREQAPINTFVNALFSTF